MKISAFDLSHVKSVYAVCLVYKGQQAGKIVANFSDNPAGSVCTTTASIWAGPLANNGKGQDGKRTVRAKGSGYNKFDSCLERLFPGNDGSGRNQEFFESKGYKYFQVI